MIRRTALLALVAALTMMVAFPASAQDDLYPPDEPEVEDQVEENGEEPVVEDDVTEEDDVEVSPLVVQRDEPLPVTGTTIGVMAAIALGALVIGGGLLLASRRRGERSMSDSTTAG